VNPLRRLVLLVRDSFGRQGLDRDVDREFEFHLEMEIEENVRRGMSRERAERAARRAFGNPRRHKQATRDARTWRALERIAGDVRHALRTFRRHPGFALTAVLTLALGLGATTAIFSVVDGVLLRPLPYPEGERIVRVGWSFGAGGGTVSALSPLKYGHVAGNARSIESLATRRSVSFALGGGPDALVVEGLRVSPSFFRAMGVQPARGRAFTPEETETDAPVVVVSDRVWRDRLGADPGALGRTIALDGEPHTVIGVMPEGFRLVDLPDEGDLFLPFRFGPDAAEERGNNYTAIGRLAPGVTRETAVAELAVLGTTFRRAYPDRVEEDEAYALDGYLEPYVSDRLRTALWGFLAGAGFVLLIACLNVISLFLARGQVREHEFSLRAVLGAPATRLARQMLTESFVLALVAAVIGSAIAAASLRVFLSLVPTDLPRADAIGIDLRVLGFTAAVAALSAFVAGLPAALPAARARLLDALAGGRSGTQGGHRRPRVRRALVAGQVATSFVLLAGAAVLFASLRNLLTVDLGFRPEGLYSVELVRERRPSPVEPEVGGRPARRADADDPSPGAPATRLARELLPRVAALPGVRSVALSANAPLERGLNVVATLARAGEEHSANIELRAVSPEYFATLPVPLGWGRAFEEADGEGAEPVALINRAFANRVADDGRGATLHIGRFRGENLCTDCPPRRVLGVVDDLREISPDREARPTAYVPIAQVAGRYDFYALPRLLVRTVGPPPSIEAVRAAATRLGFVSDVTVRPATELRAARLAVDRFNAALVGAFAIVAVTITAVGLYGFLSYMVNLRRREAGVRLAMGATPGDVVRELTMSGIGPVVVGVAAGIALTVPLSRFLESQLFRISTIDVRVLGAAAGALLLVAALAALIPARRATRIDPAGLLRHD